MPNHRVVVTGLGAVTPLGNNVRQSWAGLIEGRCAIAPMQSVDHSSLRFHNGAEVRGFNPHDHFDTKHARNLDRFTQFAVVAAREAVGDASIEWSRELRGRTAVIVGSGVGGQLTEDDAYCDLYAHKRDRVPPLTIPKAMISAAASQIAMDMEVMGPSFTVASACSSSSHALGTAFMLVRQGIASMAITGGTESPFAFGLLKAWEALRVISPETCRPFSTRRQGMVLGEGAAVLVLEPLELAVARGAHIYAEILGFGMSSDAHHITQINPEGPAKAMTEALCDAGISPSEVGYINAHGTGTKLNDPVEVQAIRAAFGCHAERLAVSSTKSMHGHALGATGAIEAMATVLALHEGVLPPTANLDEVDPECNLDIIANEARQVQARVALSNTFAFGGQNATLVIARHPFERRRN